MGLTALAGTGIGAGAFLGRATFLGRADFPLATGTACGLEGGAAIAFVAPFLAAFLVGDATLSGLTAFTVGAGFNILAARPGAGGVRHDNFLVAVAIASTLR